MCSAKIPHLHVLGHALPKGCHGKLLCEMELCCKQPLHAFAMGLRRNGLDLKLTIRALTRLDIEVSAHANTAKRFSPIP